MGRPMDSMPSSPSSSLDRLKALDTLPDLEVQLQEARKLCNHPARAEMVLRWTLGKFKSGPKYRVSSGYWDLLAACIRLLYVERVAPLLTSNGFIDSIQSTIAASDLTTALLLAVTQVFNLTLTLADKATGPQIVAALTVDSAIAASISGDWLRHVHAHWSELSAYDRRGGPLMDAPLRLWSLRSRSSADDDLFSSHCLVPVSLLLARIDAQGPNFAKRKRDLSADASHRLDIRRLLESLIAKHLVLPARAAYLEVPQMRPKKNLNDENIASEVSGISGRLRTVKAALQTDDSERLVRAVPLILDIALRSVAMPTPRQKLNERPWIESAFQALQECLPVQDRTERLAAMVDVLVRHKFSLSQPVLLNLITSNDLLSAHHQSTDLSLVASLVRLDANVFTEDVLVRSLFDTLSTCETASNHPPDNSVSTNDRIQSITTSVLTAYARDRRLSNYVALWHEQLLKLRSYSQPSLWLQTSTFVADCLESSLPEEEIFLLFDRYADAVKGIALTEEAQPDSAFSSALGASFVVLLALLRGIRSEEFPLKLQSRLDGLLLALFKVVESDGSVVAFAMPCQLWPLFTRAFELWFSTWAAQQGDAHVIAERGVSLLMRKTFDLAIAQSIALARGDDGDGPSPAVCAQMYVATLCECFLQYDQHSQCASLCTSAVQKLAKHAADARPSLLRHTELLHSMPRDLRREFTRLLLEQTLAPNQGRVSPAFLVPQDESSQADTFSFFDKQLRDSTNYEGTKDTELFALRGLHSLTRDMTAEQRKMILSTVLKLPRVELDHNGSLLLQHRLALIVEIVSVVPKENHFAENPEKLWTLATLFESECEPMTSQELPILESPSNLCMLAEVVQRIMSAWVMVQTNKGPSDDLLVDASTRIKVMCEDSRPLGAALVVLVSNAITILERCPERIKHTLPHRSSKTVEAYANHLTSNVLALTRSLATNPEEIGRKSESVSLLHATLLALSRVPETLLAQSSNHDEVAEKMAGCVKAMRQIRTQDAMISLETVLFQLDARSSAADLLYNPVAEAERILLRKLSPQDREAVLSTFSSILTKADIGRRSSILHSLVRAENPSPRAINLLQCAVRTIDQGKLDFDDQSFAVMMYIRVLDLASGESGFLETQLAWETIALMLSQRSVAINQYEIEQTISKIVLFVKTSEHASKAYTVLVGVLGTILSHHRTRMQDRFHLLVAPIQALISRLFRGPNAAASLAGIRKGRSLARLLESFGNPPRSRHRGKSSDLIDEARKAQAHAGQYAQYILHHYCGQVLKGALEAGTKDALMPGIWALIEAMEANGAEGVKVLSAAMNNSERAVLRSTYEDWTRFGKWEGL